MLNLILSYSFREKLKTYTFFTERVQKKKETKLLAITDSLTSTIPQTVTGR